MWKEHYCVVVFFFSNPFQFAEEHVEEATVGRTGLKKAGRLSSIQQEISEAIN